MLSFFFVSTSSISTSIETACYNTVFDRLDDDGSGTVEFGEFMRTFGPAIAGETMPIMMDGEERQVRVCAFNRI